jgi:phospholipid/cholesterol/gamma-HCH transport system permease protein
VSILYQAIDLLGDLGFFIRRNLTSLGLAARMFAAVIWRSGFLLKRPRLVSDQILFVGNHSFVIIAISGLFVGFVLGLQGYYTLNRYG